MGDNCFRLKTSVDFSYKTSESQSTYGVFLHIIYYACIKVNSLQHK